MNIFESYFYTVTVLDHIVISSYTAVGNAKAGQGKFLLKVPRACSRMEQVCTSGDALSTSPIKPL